MSNDSDALQNKEKGKRGRPKGSLSGPTRLLFLKCEEHGIDVFAEILKLCKNDDIAIKIKGLEMASKHLYPTLKAVEHSGSIEIDTEEQNKILNHLKELDAKGRLQIGNKKTT